MLAENEMPLVYGGSEEGLMGVLATSVIAHGGRVIGVMPEFLSEKEQPLLALKQPPHELIITQTMLQRKECMFRMADVLVTAPGGPGTRDEFWEAVTNRQVGIDRKPHIVLNVNGSLDDLSRGFDIMVDRGFASSDLKPPFVSRFEDILPHLLRARDKVVRLRTPQSAAG
jgi:uncharacterized protein (TIGR00730 family)